MRLIVRRIRSWGTTVTAALTIEGVADFAPDSIGVGWKAAHTFVDPAKQLGDNTECPKTIDDQAGHKDFKGSAEA